MTKSQIMKRAWEIYRTLIGGDRIARISVAMKQAWAEAKAPAKKAFRKFVKLAVSAWGTNHDDGSTVTNFTRWENYGKKRVYITDYKTRTIAYIDCDNNNNIVYTENAPLIHENLPKIVESFLAEYAI